MQGIGIPVTAAIRVRNIIFNGNFAGVKYVIGRRSRLTDNQNFDWSEQSEPQTFQRNTYFEKRVTLCFRMGDIGLHDIFLFKVTEKGEEIGEYGNCTFSLPTLLAKGTLEFPMGESYLDISITIPDMLSYGLRLQFSAFDLKSPNALPVNPYIVMAFPSRLCGDYMIYKSEIQRGQKNPTFAPFTFPLYPLAQLTENGEVILKVYNYNVNAKDCLIGWVSFHLSSFQGMDPGSQFQLRRPDGTEKKHAKIQFVQLEAHRALSFVDLIQNGFHIPTFIGIDFTASNGNPVDSRSKHYIHPNQLSPYEHIMNRCIPCLLPFAAGPQCSVLAFGAKQHPETDVNHCIRFGEGAVHGIRGAIDAYRRERIALIPYGPTDWSQVIRHVSNFARAEDLRHMGLYFVLLLLVDGPPTNRQKTINSIVDSSNEPISIVCISLSDSPLPAIKEFEAPDLKHSDGRLLTRQVFRYSHNPVEAMSLLPYDIQVWLANSEYRKKKMSQAGGYTQLTREHMIPFLSQKMEAQ